MRTVLLLGATGLVGRELLSQLVGDTTVSKISLISRRAVGAVSPKVAETVSDLSDMESHADVFAVNQVYCALGTTIKVAGSQEQFRKIDYEYPLNAARLGLARGATHYLLVSALGADAGSRVFYNRVKGELEDAILSLGYRSVTIARPSLLLGARSEQRRGEEFAKKLAWLTPAKYKPIEGATVARALVHAGREDAPGVTIMESREMRERFRWKRSLQY